jgi:single-strand DNA-binding protein
MYKNHVELIGFLGQDPELKSSANGRAFTRLSLATTDRWKDREGQYQERTEWHTVFCWGKRAEAAARLLKKGSHVLVEGQLRSRPVTNESTGEVAVRWAIQADTFIALRPEKAEHAPDVETSYEKEQPAATEDIPF